MLFSLQTVKTDGVFLARRRYAAVQNKVLRYALTTKSLPSFWVIRIARGGRVTGEFQVKYDIQIDIMTTIAVFILLIGT